MKTRTLRQIILAGKDYDPDTQELTYTQDAKDKHAELRRLRKAERRNRKSNRRKR